MVAGIVDTLWSLEDIVRILDEGKDDKKAELKMWTKSIASLICAGLGGMLPYGAHRRWRWLVDPNVAGWPYDSQSFIKRFFGKKAVLYYTYFTGVSMLAVACWIFWNKSK
jgi:hypothetical protein